MLHTNSLQSFFKHFLMIDVYEEASAEDKEFLKVWMFVAKMIHALCNPLSFLMFANGLIVKYLF